MKEILINKNPKSMFSESIKSIRTNLNFVNVDKKIKIILMTSPEKGDGKSFVLANLATAYALENKKVLLIDADLRLGRQHKIFNIDNKITVGYSNLILNYRKNINLSNYICKTENTNIDLLPTGPIPPNPIELLASNNNDLLFEKLKGIYDIILIDSPPVIGLSDTLVLMKNSDVNILTISLNKTKIEVLNVAKKIVEKANFKINGVVLNKASSKDNTYNSIYYS